MSSTGGSPIRYSQVVAVPPPPPPLALFISSDVRDAANHEQRLRIAEIEMEFAHRVSKELAKAYAEVLAVLREKGEDKR